MSELIRRLVSSPAGGGGPEGQRGNAPLPGFAGTPPKLTSFEGGETC